MSDKQQTYKTDEERIRDWAQTYYESESAKARRAFVCSAPTVPGALREFRKFVVEKYGGDFFTKPPGMYWEYEWFEKMIRSRNETERAVLKKRIWSNEPFEKS